MLVIRTKKTSLLLCGWAVSKRLICNCRDVSLPRSISECDGSWLPQLGEERRGVDIGLEVVMELMNVANSSLWKLNCYCRIHRWAGKG